MKYSVCTIHRQDTFQVTSLSSTQSIKKIPSASIWNLRNLTWQILSIFFFSFYPFSGFLYDFCSLRNYFFISSTVCLNDSAAFICCLTVSSNVLAVSLIIPLSLRSLDILLISIVVSLIVIVASWTAESIHQSLRSHAKLVRYPLYLQKYPLLCLRHSLLNLSFVGYLDPLLTL